MMGLSNSFGQMAVGWHLHGLFGFVLLVGAVLFVVWAVKNLSKAHLLNWAVGLIVVGVVGVLLTSAVGARGMYTMMGGLRGDVDVQKMMNWDVK